jgi:hypothetical protein
MNERGGLTAVAQPTDAPSAASSEVLYCSESPQWMLDHSIPIEVRTLISVLYRLAFREAVAKNESFKTFGLHPCSVATSYDELQAITGIQRQRLSKIVRAAEATRVLRLTGSKRAGYRYHILVPMRMYAPGPAAIGQPSAKPLSVGSRRVRSNRKQTALGEQFGSVIEPKDRPDDSESTALVSSAIELKAGSSPAAIELETPGLSSAIAPEVRGIGTVIEPENQRSNVRARDHRVTQRCSFKGNSRSGVPEDIYGELLLLGKRNDEELRPGNLVFEGAVDEIVDRLTNRFGETAMTVLSRLLSDPRVKNAEKPLAYLRRGVSEGYLIGPTSPARRAPAHTPQGAYEALPPGLRDQLQLAAEEGRATETWCRERDIPPLAAEFAYQARRVAEEEHSVTSSCPEDLRNALELARAVIPPMLQAALHSAAIEEEDDAIVVTVSTPFLRDLLEQRFVPHVAPHMQRRVMIALEPSP